ncbi:MAG TPA: ParB N-terminal domain-containing protein [Planctomycetota bacterium]|nr:ParB N-terminal domain-containing protein [Planctomycetota bacterium]
MVTKLKLPTIESVALERLKPWDRNPRKNHAVDAIARSIENFGYLSPIVVQKGTYRILAGHGRLEALKKQGVTKVPVVVADITDEQASLYTLADNKLTELAEWDEELLAGLVKDLSALDLDLSLSGFSNEELKDLASWMPENMKEETHPIPEPPVVPVSQPGDLWALGEHRILCGDSTMEDDVRRLMDGQRAVLMATDPPYLVDYTGGNHPQSWSNRPEVKDKHWDEYQDPQASGDFFFRFLEVALREALVPNPAVYQWHASRRQILVEEAWKRAGLFVHQQIIWAKARPILTHSHYMWQHEPCFYGWIEGNLPAKRPEPNLTTVWQIDQKEIEGVHPTEKPLEIFGIPIRAHTRPGDVCFEPFSGSGSQIIAGEREGRRVYAIEIAPAFVDVAVQRWENFTGKKGVNETRPGVRLPS